MLITYLPSSAKTEDSPATLKTFSLMSVYFEFSVLCHEVRSMISDDQVDENVAA